MFEFFVESRQYEVNPHPVSCLLTITFPFEIIGSINSSVVYNHNSKNLVNYLTIKSLGDIFWQNMRFYLKICPL